MQYLCTWPCLIQCTYPSSLNISPYTWEGATPWNTTIWGITSRESPDGHDGTKVSLSQQHTLEQRPAGPELCQTEPCKQGKEIILPFCQSGSLVQYSWCDSSRFQYPEWGYSVRKGMELVQRVQWKATDTKRGLEHLSHQERLRQMGLFILEKCHGESYL